MSKRKLYLLGIAFSTLLFISLVMAGSYLISIGSKQFGIACFLFAFGAVFVQIAFLALYIRLIVYQKAMKELAAQQQNSNKEKPNHV
ncbi:NGO_0222 family membrane protein [Neisseria weaveri]|uniref:Uncharacterized protein n=1 Tax=Neisseria weaveri TaxID=28091 RepID=A0A3S4Z7K9_9NEIS|nr:NGO_0222 family membrane protein [Neisseria weaveri]EGV36295.1 hypothetical protein l13_08560 [Neisseria weaveri ATCC 51223]EGV38896.1 hypothetical protein l11_03430 [Neisseria weaveri LMG 5135]VEJ50245.1 Uncharacterised protein [Neisseria weaveri]